MYEPVGINVTVDSVEKYAKKAVAVDFNWSNYQNECWVKECHVKYAFYDKRIFFGQIDVANKGGQVDEEHSKKVVRYDDGVAEPIA